MNSFASALGLLTYEQFIAKFSQWVAQQETSGRNQSAALVGFTKLNWARSQRLQKTLQIKSELKAATSDLAHQYSFIVITEAWCGDSAQVLPYLAEWVRGMKNGSGLFVALRDEHPGLMDKYLTSGARSIPKLVIIDETIQQEVAVWGPRPVPAQEIVLNWKKAPTGRSWEEMERELHTWYAMDKGESLQAEWLYLVTSLIEQEMGSNKITA